MNPNNLSFSPDARSLLFDKVNRILRRYSQPDTAWETAGNFIKFVLNKDVVRLNGMDPPDLEEYVLGYYQ